MARVLSWRIVGEIEALGLIVREIQLPDHHRIMLVSAQGDIQGLAEEIGRLARKAKQPEGGEK